MAKVFMCDRCGQIFDPNKTEEISIDNVSFAKIRPVVTPRETPKLVPETGNWIMSDGTPDATWDICSTCLRDFQRWWNIPKTERRG